MNTIWNIFHIIKTTLKFLWRHFFTLTIFIWILCGLAEGPINFHNCLIMQMVAVIFDWIKMKIKLGDHSVSQSSDIPLHMKSWNNPSVIGSPFYNLSNPSHHL
jgi:hypothetical protein